MTEDDELREDFIQQMKMDAREEEHYEKKMYSDEQYALDQLGLADVIESIEDLAKQMTEYGYEYSVKDVLENI